MGTLYLVATPIGNLEDISQRALRILTQANMIAAEDTRRTARLLQHYGIHQKTISYHEHNKLARLDLVLAALQQGDVALVSDAGTPGLNDPGYELVRAALDAGHQVSPIPGPCAPVAALVASGLPTDAFLYLGYLPRRDRERRRAIQDVAELPCTLIFLESPHRLVPALSDLLSILGDRPAAIARELTKLHEEIRRGRLAALRDHFESSPPRGEFTLVIGGKQEQNIPWTEQKLRETLLQRVKIRQPTSQTARELAAASGWSKSRIYDLIKELNEELP